MLTVGNKTSHQYKKNRDARDDRYKLVTEAESSLRHQVLAYIFNYLLHCAKNLADLEDLIDLAVARK